jgi:5-methylcytosine-specific restriction endonuclease McrA
MEEKCKCGKDLIFTLIPHSVHYGRLDCPKCGYIKFVKNPINEGRRNETSKFDLGAVLNHHKMKEPICFFCLRNNEQLGIKETLTIDHIQELEKGGKDELENLQILCSACHKLKNWARLYLNWHLSEKNG